MTVIDDVRGRIDIVDLVSETVQLKRSGRSYKANCPFHSEKTPSFIVTPDRQSWHCFGSCSTGGDVFGFVMKRDNIEFGDALRMLAERAGVSLRDRDPAKDDRFKRLHEAADAAALYFHNLLLNHPAGQVARDYLSRRETSAEAVQQFMLGYSLDEWEGLLRHMTSRGFSQPELLEAGLLVEGERGIYDRFRGRIIYPIRDDRGRVAGFGGRALDDTPPKYLNTPQSPLFDKGAILYGLDLAKDAIRRADAVVLVEGYMDVIAAHQRGIANVVAPMGTALTEKQIALLKRYSSNIVLALDADAAGQLAALRDVEALRSSARAGGADLATLSLDEVRMLASRVDRMVSSDLRVLQLPAGQDPDDVLRAGVDEWQRLVENASSYIEFRFHLLSSRADLTDTRARADLATALLPDVASISQPLVREQYLERLAAVTRIDAVELRRQLRKARTSTAAPAGRPTPGAAPESRHRDRREEYLLALLFRFPSLRDAGLELEPDLFVEQENRVLFDAWRQYMEIEATRDHLLPEVAPRLDEISIAVIPPIEESMLPIALRDVVLRLRKARLQEQKRAHGARVAEIEERSGARVVVEAAQAALDGSNLEDEALREDVTRYLEDAVAGTELHEVERALRDRARSFTTRG